MPTHRQIILALLEQVVLPTIHRRQHDNANVLIFPPNFPSASNPSVSDRNERIMKWILETENPPQEVTSSTHSTYDSASLLSGSTAWSQSSSTRPLASSTPARSFNPAPGPLAASSVDTVGNQPYRKEMLYAGTILICSSIESIASNLYQESFSRYIIHGYFAKMARRCFDVDISILATIIHILRAPLLSSNEFKTKWFNQLLEQPPLDPKGAKEPLGDPEISLPSYYRHVAPKHELLILTTLALATDLLYANLSAASQAAGWAFEVSNGRFSKQQYWCVKGVVSDAVQGIETEVWMDLGEEMGEIEKEAGRLLSLRLCYGDDSLR